MSMAPSSSPISRWSRGAKPSAAKSRGVPMVSSTTKSSSPPRGTSSNTRLGRAFISSSKVAPDVVRLGLGRLHLHGQLPGAGQHGGLLVALGTRRPACRAPSAPRAGSRRTRSPSAATRPQLTSSSTSSTDSPRASWERRTRSGSVRSSFGSITESSLSPWPPGSAGLRLSRPRGSPGTRTSPWRRAKSASVKPRAISRTYPVGARVGAEEQHVRADPVQALHGLGQPRVAQVALGVDAEAVVAQRRLGGTGLDPASG